MACVRCRQRRRHKNDSGSENESVSDSASSSDDDRNEVVEHYVAPPEYEEREWDSMFFPQLARAMCSAGALCAADGDDEDAALPPTKSTRDARLTASFRVEAEFLPQASRPPADSADLIIHEQQLPNVSVEQLLDAIQEDAVLEGYLAQFAQAWDVSITNWTNSPSGLRVRRAEFTMPVPQEVPAAIARLVNVPQSSKATIVLGFASTSPDELLVLIQQYTHDVPYGASFRVQEIMSFRSAAGGGTTFSKWTSIRWVQDLPWIAKAIKPITESKTRAGSPAGGQAFVRLLQEAAGVDTRAGRRIPTLKEVTSIKEPGTAQRKA